jgi:hypothetical protein
MRGTSLDDAARALAPQFPDCTRLRPSFFVSFVASCETLSVSVTSERSGFTRRHEGHEGLKTIYDAWGSFFVGLGVSAGFAVSGLHTPPTSLLRVLRGFVRNPFRQRHFGEIPVHEGMKTRRREDANDTKD